MSDKDLIVTYYSNAKELVKLKNSNAAKEYVKAIINISAKHLDAEKNYIDRINAENFIRQWANVYFDLKNKGITDNVLKSFGLLKDEKPLPLEQNADSNNSDSSSKSSNIGGINMAGLIDDVDMKNIEKSDVKQNAELRNDYSSQGWCASVFENNKNAVVEISIDVGDNIVKGTGFIISKNGYILTNYHIVYDNYNECFYKKVTFSLIGNDKKYKLEPLFANKGDDIALCEFNPNEISSFSTIKCVSDYSKVLQGADCLVIGNAFGLGLAPFTGIVRFTKNYDGDLVYSAPANPGDSGAPVLNRFGQCIGINKSITSKIDGVKADGYSNATPMDKINKFLDKFCSANGIVL